MSEATTDLILAVIFIIILMLGVIARRFLKKPILAKVIVGVGALFLTGTAYALNNYTVPLWLLAAAGIAILVDAWFSKKKQKKTI